MTLPNSSEPRPRWSLDDGPWPSGGSVVLYRLTELKSGQIVMVLNYETALFLHSSLNAYQEDCERALERFVEHRIGHDTPCSGCSGLGVRAYGSTATWRGGIGGQAITGDVCDKCWGSGSATHPWRSWREIESLLQQGGKL